MDKMSLTFSEGLLILIEGDNNNWYNARDWQAKEFIEAMKFGTMKSMGHPNPRTETDIFKIGRFKYQFIILNDWGPCYLKNIDTGKEREIKYLELQSSNKNYVFSEEAIYPVKIKIS
jgi:hypothetical protein